MVLRQDAPQRKQRPGASAPGGVPLGVSDVLPSSTHDLTAARELVFPEARPYLKELPILADSGYKGAGAGVHVPVKSLPAANWIPTPKPVTHCCVPCATRANAVSP